MSSLRVGFALLILFVICNSVNAIPPDVNFTFTPLSPSSNQLITFDPNVTTNGTVTSMQWQFDTDGNTNHFAGTTTNLLIDSSFNTNFSGWTTNGGTWSIVSNLLHVTAGSDQDVYHSVTYPSPALLPIIKVNTRIKVSTADSGFICFNQPTNAAVGNQCTTYGVRVRDNADVIDFVYGGSQLLVLQTGVNPATIFDINITRTPDGNFSFVINGVGSGSIVNTTSDINGLFVALGTGGGVADFGYTQVISIVSTSVNPDLNETHTFTTGGNKNVCLTAGNIDGNTTTCNTVVVSATAPLVDFTIVPPNGLTGDLITFDPAITANGTINNMRWMFDVDGNTNIFSPPPINIDLNQTHTFTSAGVKNICLTAGNNDANVTVCHTMNIAGFASFRIQDENTSTPIVGATVTIDNNSQITNASGDVNFFTASFNFPITVFVSAPGYDNRSFVFLTVAGAAQDFLLNLRSAPTAQDIDFQFFAPDEIAVLGNRIISVTKNGGISGRILTDSTGKGTFNLAPQDGAYLFLTYPAGLDVGSPEFTYTPVTVTVQHPIDEVTDLAILPNLFSLDIDILGSQNLVSIPLPTSSITILGNTTTAYSLFVVDSNVDGQQYFGRNYIMQAKGDVNVLNIQPFLIPITDGILVNLKVIDISTNQTVPNIRIQMYAQINSANTLVEDHLTDSAGIAQFTMISQKTYKLLITSPNQDINYFNGFQTLVASSQSFTIHINFFNNQVNVTPQNTTISILPTTTVLTSSPQLFQVFVDTNAPFDFIYVQAFDSNTIVDQNNCSASPCNVTMLLNLNNFDSNFLNIIVTIQNGDFNYTKNINYILSGFVNNIVSRIQSLKFELSPVSLGLIMFAVIFAAIAFLGGNVLGNNISQIFIIVIIAGVFYFLWFYDVTQLFGGPLFVGFLAALFGVMLIYFWSRQKGGP